MSMGRCPYCGCGVAALSERSSSSPALELPLVVLGPGGEYGAPYSGTSTSERLSRRELIACAVVVVITIAVLLCGFFPLQETPSEASTQVASLCLITPTERAAEGSRPDTPAQQLRVLHGNVQPLQATPARPHTVAA